MDNSRIYYNNYAYSQKNGRMEWPFSATVSTPMLVLSLAWPHPVPQEREGSGNFFYSSLFHRSVQCGTNHSAVFCHMSAVITTSVGNYKV